MTNRFGAQPLFFFISRFFVDFQSAENLSNWLFSRSKTGDFFPKYIPKRFFNYFNIFLYLRPLWALITNKLQPKKTVFITVETVFITFKTVFITFKTCFKNMLFFYTVFLITLVPLFNLKFYKKWKF